MDHPTLKQIEDLRKDLPITLLRDATSRRVIQNYEVIIIKRVQAITYPDHPTIYSFWCSDSSGSIELTIFGEQGEDIKESDVLLIVEGLHEGKRQVVINRTTGRIYKIGDFAKHCSNEPNYTFFPSSPNPGVPVSKYRDISNGDKIRRLDKREYRPRGGNEERYRDYSARHTSPVRNGQFRRNSTRSPFNSSRKRD
ncbi:hypothetical protein K502DRAFT_362094 [Neoconidiobolus thromboides FSU 785]|nr:hypothetical protein K502DRAFT_362094 [Neoconidiobolus thromboides FSU 785]